VKQKKWSVMPRLDAESWIWLEPLIKKVSYRIQVSQFARSKLVQMVNAPVRVASVFQPGSKRRLKADPMFIGCRELLISQRVLRVVVPTTSEERVAGAQ
jgi:hypothetical protein